MSLTKTYTMNTFRQDCKKYFESLDFKEIKEISVIDTTMKQDFNTSLLVAHSKTILDSEETKMFSLQRVFFPKIHNDGIRTPLLSFFQVMCNFYLKDSDLNNSLKIAVDFLNEITKIDFKKIRLMINEQTFHTHQIAFRNHFEENQIWVRKKKNQYSFFYNEEKVVGEYIKFFIETNDGIFPIYDLVLMNHNGKIIIECGGILERLYFIHENEKTIFDTNLYGFFIYKIKEVYGRDIFKPEVDYLGYYIAHMLRSITIVMLDGLIPSNKTPRTKALRYWMKFLMIRISLYNLSPFSILELLDSTFESIANSGYLYKENSYSAARSYWEKEIVQLYKTLPEEFINLYTKGHFKNESTYSKVFSISNKKTQKFSIQENLRYSHAYPFPDELSELKIIKDVNHFYNIFIKSK